MLTRTGPTRTRTRTRIRDTRTRTRTRINITDVLIDYISSITAQSGCCHTMLSVSRHVVKGVRVEPPEKPPQKLCIYLWQTSIVPNSTERFNHEIWQPLNQLSMRIYSSAAYTFVMCQQNFLLTNFYVKLMVSG